MIWKTFDLLFEFSSTERMNIMKSLLEERLEKGVTLQRIFPEEIIPPKGEAETIAGPCRALP